jgi:hypothetical protein
MTNGVIARRLRRNAVAISWRTLRASASGSGAVGCFVAALLAMTSRRTIGNAAT